MSCFLQITVLFYTNVISICNCSFKLPFLKLITYILNQNNLDTMLYIQCYNVLSFKVLVSFEHVNLCNQNFQIQAMMPYWSLSYSNVVILEILILEVVPIWIPQIWGSYIFRLHAWGFQTWGFHIRGCLIRAVVLNRGAVKWS